eukprot:COSAG04_NODE_17153_length_477_cov_1.386243_1_plen_36_part_01
MARPSLLAASTRAAAAVARAALLAAVWHAAIAGAGG